MPTSSQPNMKNNQQQQQNQFSNTKCDNVRAVSPATVGNNQQMNNNNSKIVQNVQVNPVPSVVGNSGLRPPVLGGISPSTSSIGLKNTQQQQQQPNFINNNQPTLRQNNLMSTPLPNAQNMFQSNNNSNIF